LGVHALKRLVLTPERLADEEIDAIEITEAPNGASTGEWLPPYQPGG
jgi:hypothetical protein